MLIRVELTSGSPRRRPTPTRRRNRPPISQVRYSTPDRGCAAPVGTTGASASGSVFGRRGESPLQVCTLRPVTESNCVAARRGGEQLEVNDRSAAKANSIRPGLPASLLASGEARTDASRRPATLRGSVSKRSWGWRGGWRRNGRKAKHVNQRELRGPVGVHCPRRTRRTAPQKSERP